MTAIDVIELLRAGEFAAVHELFLPQLRAMVPAESIKAAWAAATEQYGDVVEIGTPTTNQGVTRVPVGFARGRQTLLLTMTGDGQLGGIQLAPESAAAPVEAWLPPSYVDQAAFTEHEVTLGSDELAVRGTLSVPRRPGPFPGVVLLSGSGAHDRDETIGRNKPLKDIAWGLAGRGVAVLRFDKVTLTHAEKVVRMPDFTVNDEYVPAVRAAIAVLREHTDRIFLVGHSLGGTVAPRIAATEQVAGLVLLAAGAQPLYWSAVRQFRYLASLGAAKGISDAVIDAATRQAELIDSPDFSPATPADELPFGVPAAYWLDLRSYDPAAAAAELKMPILIVQGGRDYQITVADDLSRWRERLADRPNVTIQVYEADNHLFFPGTGPSTPDEYEPAQHVDPDVVADIAAWLTAHS